MARSLPLQAQIPPHWSRLEGLSQANPGREAEETADPSGSQRPQVAVGMLGGQAGGQPQIS